MTTKSQQRKNRLHLADMLENRIKDTNFDMAMFSNHCGTIGCALGIAVMSGEFGYGWRDCTAVKNGRFVDWDDAGADLFGEQTHDDVFLNYNERSRQAVAAELRAIK